MLLSPQGTVATSGGTRQRGKSAGGVGRAPGSASASPYAQPFALVELTRSVPLGTTRQPTRKEKNAMLDGSKGSVGELVGTHVFKYTSSSKNREPTCVTPRSY